MNEPFPAGYPGHDIPGYHRRSQRGQQPIDRSDGVELVRLTHPRDVVTAVPYLLGFQPDPGSIVVLALRDDRIELTIRVTAPPPDEAPALWGRLAKPLDDAGAEYVSVVGYLPAEQDPLLLAFADAAPVPPVDVLRVHEGRWWSLTCPNDPGCCPPGELITPNPAVAAPLIAGTGAPADSRADLATCLQPGPAEMVDAVAALLPVTPLPPAPVLFRCVIRALLERADGPVPVGPEQAALLLQALSEIPVRDVCCGWYDDAASWLWTDLIRATPPDYVPPVATLIATTAYQRGNVVLAQLATDHALTFDPGYGLARLMHAAISAHVHPDLIRDAIDFALTETAALPGYADLHLPTRPGAGDAADEQPRGQEDSDE
jgi:hypothetical protein